MNDRRDDHFRRRASRRPARSRAGAGGAPESAPVAESDPAPEPTPARGRTLDRGTRGLLLATGACILGCAVLIATADSNLMTFLGISLGGIAFVLVLSTVFYAVGRSEDRDREQRPGG